MASLFEEAEACCEVEEAGKDVFFASKKPRGSLGKYGLSFEFSRGVKEKGAQRNPQNMIFSTQFDHLLSLDS